jgi:hypothetical protein
MKSSFFVMAIFCSLFFFAFKMADTGTVTGKYTPTDAVEYVWAINATDSTKVQPSGGTFELTLKPGDYKVVVDANQKYQDVVIDKVTVTDGKTTDLGEIALKQNVQ